MNHQEIMAVMAEVYNRLYRTSFHGEQAMIVVDCERMLFRAMQNLNENIDDKDEENEDNPAG